MEKSRLLDWQRRFRERPGVWTVVIGAGAGEETGNYYDSREAAEYEVAWRKAHGRKSARVSFLTNLHDVQLSRERWSRDTREAGKDRSP